MAAIPARLLLPLRARRSTRTQLHLILVTKRCLQLVRWLWSMLPVLFFLVITLPCLQNLIEHLLLWINVSLFHRNYSFFYVKFNANCNIVMFAIPFSGKRVRFDESSIISSGCTFLSSKHIFNGCDPSPTSIATAGTPINKNAATSNPGNKEVPSTRTMSMVNVALPTQFASLHDVDYQQDSHEESHSDHQQVFFRVGNQTEIRLYARCDDLFNSWSDLCTSKSGASRPVPNSVTLSLETLLSNIKYNDLSVFSGLKFASEKVFVVVGKVSGLPLPEHTSNRGGHIPSCFVVIVPGFKSEPEKSIQFFRYSIETKREYKSIHKYYTASTRMQFELGSSMVIDLVLQPRVFDQRLGVLSCAGHQESALAFNRAWGFKNNTQVIKATSNQRQVKRFYKSIKLPAQIVNQFISWQETLNKRVSTTSFVFLCKK